MCFLFLGWVVIVWVWVDTLLCFGGGAWGGGGGLAFAGFEGLGSYLRGQERSTNGLFMGSGVRLGNGVENHRVGRWATFFLTGLECTKERPRGL